MTELLLNDNFVIFVYSYVPNKHLRLLFSKKFPALPPLIKSSIFPEENLKKVGAVAGLPRY